MAQPKRVSDADLIATYEKTGNVHKAGELLGIRGSSVQERLVKLGVRRVGVDYFTDEEVDRLKREYLVYRDAGKVRELAADMGRTLSGVVRKAGELGLTDTKKPKPWLRTWKGMSESAARVIFEKFKGSKWTVGQFCAREGYDDEGFSKTMRSYFPDEYDLVVESKVPKTLYRRGRGFEYRVRDDLRKAGYFVLRSPRSGSPVDLVALRTGQALLVQCKLGGDLWSKAWSDLYWLAQSVGCVPILAASPKGQGIEYWRLTGPARGRARGRPRELFDPWYRPEEGVVELPEPRRVEELENGRLL